MAKAGSLKYPEGFDDVVPLDFIFNWYKSREQNTGIKNRVLILKATTGSGKSTLFVSTIYIKAIRDRSSRGILVTQPRVITAIRNVLEIVKYHPTIFKLGDSIGWSTKFNKHKAKTQGLLSCTIQTLAVELKSNTDQQIMDKYAYIFIDECHERDLQTDLTLFVLKNFLRRNEGNLRCPMVTFMSATLDFTALLKYFDLKMEENYIYVEGLSYPIEKHWEWNQNRTVNNMAQAAAEVVNIIVHKNPTEDPLQADIIIFVPGKYEMGLVEGWLKKTNIAFIREGILPGNILQIDSDSQRENTRDYKQISIPTEKQQIVIDGKCYTPGRRIIIATNVAETGLTLHNLGYCVDSGFNREIEFNPIYGIRGLVTKPAPIPRITQRMGRVGRNFPGQFYPLYPKFIYDMLQPQQFAQIITEDISVIFLDIIREQLKFKILSHIPAKFLVSDIDMLDAPGADATLYAMGKLHSLGMISPRAPRLFKTAEGEIVAPIPGGRWGVSERGELRDLKLEYKDTTFGVTALGLIATNVMLTPELVRIIFAGFSWGCSVLDLITIAAYLTMQSNDLDIDLMRKVNWKVVYESGMPVNVVKNDAFSEGRLLMVDGFIEGLVLFNAIKKTLVEGSPITAFGVLRAWCERAGVRASTAFAFIRARDDIIDQLIGIGIDVFAGQSEAFDRVAPMYFMDTVTRLKYCIFEGFRTNIVHKHDDGYYLASGVKVGPPAMFSNDKVPEGYVFVSNEIRLKQNKKTGVYSAVCDRISAMSGFVHVDTGFVGFIDK